jgi:hypothetical protein
MNLLDRPRFRLVGAVYVGHRARPGWSGSLPFYRFRCSAHGLVEDYPHGFEGRLECPSYVEEWARKRERRV